MKMSEAHFERTLIRKTRESQAAVDNCVRVFLSDKVQKRQSAANEALRVVSFLVDMVDPGERPPWLMPLHDCLIRASKNPGNDHGVEAVMQIASKHLSQLENTEWHVKGSAEVSGFDFDAVFEKYKKQCKIPELFDKIIACLKEILENEKVKVEIDSLRLIKELQAIITTLQSSRNGSYFATISTWKFVTTWFKNTLWELFGRFPILGAPVKGLRDTLIETDKAFSDLHEKLQADFEIRLREDFPKFKYDPPKLPAPNDNEKHEEIQDE